MADEKDQADADVQDDATLPPVELEDLPPVEFDQPPLTEEEEVALAAAGSRPVRKSATVESKGRPTRKQAAASAKPHEHRTTPAQFTRESVEELKKVIWPTMRQWQQYFIVVLVFVLFIIAIVSALDLLFGWALLKIFG